MQAGAANTEQQGAAVRVRWFALALAPYLTWALCVRCSPMLFVGAATTQPSYLFLVGLTAGATVALVVLWLLATRRHRQTSQGRLDPMWLVGCLCAAAGTLPCLTPWCAGLPTAPIALVVGALVGVSYGLALPCAIAVCRQIGVSAFMRTLTLSLGCALVVLVALCLWVPQRWLALAGLLPLASWAVLRLGPAARTSAVGEARGIAAQHAPIPWGRLGALLACVGFFAAFVVGMHPKSAHLPWLVSGVTYLGALSSRSLIYLLVYGILLALFACGLGRRSANSRQLPLLISMVLVYAVMFFTLPFMKQNGIATSCNNALSLLFLTLAVPALASLPAKQALGASSLLAAGALGAAVAAAVFMGPLFNVLPHQDEVFVALPFVVNLAVLVLGVTLGPWLCGTLLPQEAAEAPNRTIPTPADTAAWEQLAASWGLTARETQVLELIAQGRNEPYMSEHLCISRATVKTHVNHIYKKAGVPSRQELLNKVHGEE